MYGAGFGVEMVCNDCGTASLSECWICGNKDLEVQFLSAPLYPGALISEILDA